MRIIWSNILLASILAQCCLLAAESKPFQVRHSPEQPRSGSILECVHHYDIANGKNYFYYFQPKAAVDRPAVGRGPDLGGVVSPQSTVTGTGYKIH